MLRLLLQKLPIMPWQQLVIHLTEILPFENNQISSCGGVFSFFLNGCFGFIPFFLHAESKRKLKSLKVKNLMR